MESILQIVKVSHQLAVPINQVDESPSATRYGVRLVREALEFPFKYFELTSEMHREAEEEAVYETLTSA